MWGYVGATGGVCVCACVHVCMLRVCMCVYTLHHSSIGHEVKKHILPENKMAIPILSKVYIYF